MADEVTRLGAWCDLARAGHERLSFDVSEWIELADGRRVTLHADRGFGVAIAAGRLVGDGTTEPQSTPDAWLHVSRERLEADVLTAVLPDDAEVTGEDHPWEELAALSNGHGIEVTPADLRAVPYVVEFTDQVLERLRRGGR